MTTPSQEVREAREAAEKEVNNFLSRPMVNEPGFYVQSLLDSVVAGKRRTEQCCECNAFVSDWVEADHTNGRICRPCETVLALRSAVAGKDEALFRTVTERNKLEAELAQLREELHDSRLEAVDAKLRNGPFIADNVALRDALKALCNAADDRMTRSPRSITDSVNQRRHLEEKIVEAKTALASLSPGQPMLDAVEKAAVALEHCYDVMEYPATPDCEQAKALAALAQYRRKG